jgi:hypothetical protein
LAKEKSIALRESREKKEKKNKKRSGSFNVDDAFFKCVHFNVRTVVKNAAYELPQHHETDKDVALYCAEVKQRTLADPVPPAPQSQFAVICLAGLQQAKNPRFFEKMGQKRIETFKLKPEFLERTVEICEESIQELYKPTTLFGSRLTIVDDFDDFISMPIEPPVTADFIPLCNDPPVTAGVLLHEDVDDFDRSCSS